MPRSRLLLLAAICSALLFSTTAVCQDARAHVQGTVTDPSGAAISGAAVTLMNVNTGVVTRATTNDTGLYRLDYIDPGTYVLNIESTGFAKFIKQNFEIQAQADITWLNGRHPRPDGLRKRPLPFDAEIKPKPALCHARGNQQCPGEILSPVRFFLCFR